MNDDEMVVRMDLCAQFMLRIFDEDFPTLTVMVLHSLLDPTTVVQNMERHLDMHRFNGMGGMTYQCRGLTETVTCTWVKQQE